MTYRVYDKDTNLESTVRIALRVYGIKIGPRIYCKDMTYRVYDKDTSLESTV